MFLTGLFTLLANVMFFTGFVAEKNSYPTPLSPEKESELLDKMREGDKDARDELIKHNMRLVVHIGKKYSSYYDIDELISIGSIGLIKAVNTFVRGKGTQLATYAARCIENEILMMLRADKKVKATKSLYEPVSYDKDGNEVALIDLLEQNEESVLSTVENKLAGQKLLEIVHAVLAGRELEIIEKRYGLTGREPKTQKEVAGELKISRSYVSRIETKALGKLKDYIDKNRLSF